VTDDEDFMPEDPIGPVAEKKPILNRLALFVVEHAFGLIILGLAIGLGIVVWVINRPPQLTPEQTDRVEYGMTEREVDKVLGFQSTGPGLFIPAVPTADAFLPIDWKAWEDGKTTFVAGFVDGRVRYKKHTLKPQR
jgi:hypothetical protein